jgi:hypothetical protein
MLPFDPNPRARSILALVLVALLLLLFIVPLPSPARLSLRILLSWYLLMSFCDWALHRYVLHDDRTPMPAWRRGHRKHHLEYDTGIGHSGVSVTFPHADAALIALATLPLGLLVGLPSMSQPSAPSSVAIATLAHFVGITIVVGVHNYAHSVFHFYPPPPWKSHACVPVPDMLLEVLHEHHLRHHEDSRVNYCTVLLGFDSLAGTVPSAEDSCCGCFWPLQFWSHVPHDPITGQPVPQGKPTADCADNARLAVAALSDLKAAISSKPSAISRLDASNDQASQDPSQPVGM